MQAKVSAIVPIYNVEKYLEQCLDSIIGQTLREIEIILVNDGSTDSSLSIIEDYASRDSRIIVIDKPNAGYGHSMNRGLEKATGKYIAIVEPDDYLDLHMFEDLYNAGISFDPHAQIVRSPYWRVLVGAGKKERVFPSPHKTRVKPDHQPFTITECPKLLFFHPSIWAAIYERTFLLEHDITFHEIPGAGWADNPFFIETFAAAERIAYVDNCYYYYREDNPAASTKLKDYTIPLDRWNEIQDVLDRMGIDTPEVCEAQAVRGINYTKEASGSKDADTHLDELRAGIEKIYGRIDKQALLDSACISKKDKLAYLSVVDPGYNGPIGGGYNAHLAHEFIDTVRGGGLWIAFYRVRSALGLWSKK